MLGKQGKTITQLRAETNVSVRVVEPPWVAHSANEGERRPESLSELESKLEILQVEGRQILALAAVRAASSLLREWQVCSILPCVGRDGVAQFPGCSHAS